MPFYQIPDNEFQVAGLESWWPRVYDCLWHPSAGVAAGPVAKALLLESQEPTVINNTGSCEATVMPVAVLFL